MSTHLEVAYLTGRIEQSKAQAAAATSMSARASHEGIVKAYEERLAALTGGTMPALSTVVERSDVSQEPNGRSDGGV